MISRQRRWQLRNRQAARAQESVKRALRSGKLTPKPCERCGSTVHLEAHHDDYSKPLAVTWYCDDCHKRWHRLYSPVVSEPDMLPGKPGRPRRV